jgi:prophage DNA circulation protein
MNKVMFFGLATAMVLSAGCKKNEEGKTEVMTVEEVVEQTAVVTEKAEEVTQQAAEAVSAFTVKAEDVMSDLNQSVQEIKTKVANFDKTQVLAYANEYKTVILEKKDELSALTTKLKGLSMTEMVGEKGKVLKGQLAQYSDQLGALKDRYGIYLDKLKEYGVDLSAYGL